MAASWPMAVEVPGVSAISRMGASVPGAMPVESPRPGSIEDHYFCVVGAFTTLGVGKVVPGAVVVVVSAANPMYVSRPGVNHNHFFSRVRFDHNYFCGAAMSSMVTMHNTAEQEATQT
ncbi:MAG: hypothetical protein D6805_00595 [Planctomycetota bacterium]|nr:MAG: hypothetical protein D6805_00595 [Planctomycetota bacterium]